MRSILLGVGVVLALIGTFIAGRATTPTEAESYVPRRAWILVEAARRTPDGGVLMIGDSLTERSGFVTLCDMPVFNAGVSMARTEDMRLSALKLAEELKPDLTVVALGANDARMATSLDVYRQEMTEMLSELPRPLMLVSLPSLPGYEDMVKPYNAILLALAQQEKLALIEPIRYEVSDGLHQSPAGAYEWRKTIEKSCPS